MPGLTKLPNAYLERFASDLTGPEKSAMTVVLIDTRGKGGAKWHVFGRDSAEVSAQSIADRTGMSRRTAQLTLRSLVDKGWLVIVKHGKGRRPHQYAPNPTPPRPEQPKPPEPVVTEEDAEMGAEAIAAYVIRRQQERHKAAIRHGIGDN